MMAFCMACSSPLSGGARFCSVCGASTAASDAAASAASVAGTPAAPPGRHSAVAAPSAPITAASPPSTLSPPMGAVATFAASAALAILAWDLLAIPARIPTGILATAVPYGCPYQTQTPAMYLCSAKIAAARLVGPVLVTILIVVFRRKLAALVQSTAPKLPANAQFLVAPLVATIAFTLAWAGSHYEGAANRGIVSQRMFPAFIGLFTYAAARWGPVIQQKYRGFFDFRDRFPTWIRVGVALVVPLVISLAITYEDRVTAPVLKEQVVVLISVLAGYLALAPRSGGLGRMMEK